MYYLPEDSPKKEKVVFFKDEEMVLKLIKHEYTTQLNDYINTHGLPDGLYDRLIGYSVNMLKPFSFKSLALRDMTRIPDDVMKRVFHTILCEVIDGADDSIGGVANEFYDFLKEYGKVDKDDITNALDIYYDYDNYLTPVLSDVVTKIQTQNE